MYSKLSYIVLVGLFTVLTTACDFDDILGPDEENIPVAVHNRIADTGQVFFFGTPADPLLPSGEAYNYEPRVRVRETYGRGREDREGARIAVAMRNIRTGELSRTKHVSAYKDRPGSVEFTERDFR